VSHDVPDGDACTRDTLETAAAIRDLEGLEPCRGSSDSSLDPTMLSQDSLVDRCLVSPSKVDVESLLALRPVDRKATTLRLGIGFQDLS
jgi:hypothetical protein